MTDLLATFKRLWLWPIIFGIGTLFGLAIALVADGIWDWVGALSITVPVIISIKIFFNSLDIR